MTERCTPMLIGLSSQLPSGVVTALKSGGTQVLVKLRPHLFHVGRPPVKNER